MSVPGGIRTRSALPVSALVTALALFLPAVTGCSGGSGTPERTPAQLLETAKANADAATSVHVTVTSRDVPGEAMGILGLEGTGTRAPAFSGTVTARISGVVATVDAVAIGPDLWLKLPFSSRHARVSPADWGLPSPVRLFSADEGLTTLLTATQDPADAGQERDGDQVVRTITGTVPGSVVSGVLATGDPAGAYQVTFGITEPDTRFASASITGPFFSGGNSTYDLSLDRYGEPVRISAP